MANMIDYIRWRGDLSFTASPMNEVDSVLFVFLSFLDFSGIVPEYAEDGSVTLRDAVRICFAKDSLTKEKDAYYGAIMPNRDIFRMAKLMASSERFGNVRLTAYQRIVCRDYEEQFAAYCAICDDNSILVSFQGTDDSVVGWKEDLNLAIVDVIPGQRRSAEYLNSVASVLGGRIRVSGHSKGGNLAIYSASKCNKDVQNRILRVYNHDGPGFSRGFLESEDYLAIKEKVVKIVPEESIIGVIFESDKLAVVKSAKSGFNQHNSFLWEVSGNHFVRRKELSRSSKELGRVLNEWLSETDTETRRNVIDAIYELISTENSMTLTDLSRDKTRLWKALVKLEPQKREFVFKALTRVLSDMLKSMVRRSSDGSDCEGSDNSVLEQSAKKQKNKFLFKKG